MKTIQESLTAKMEKQLNMLYASISFLGFFSAQGCIAYRLIYPWRGLGVHGSLILFICFATVPFVIYPKFKEFAQQLKIDCVKPETGEKLNRRLKTMIVFSIGLSIAIPFLPYIPRCFAIISNTVLIPCGLFWSTDAYKTYFHQLMEKQQYSLAREERK